MFAQIKQFITENAQRLSSQLSTFEGNVAKETADIRASFQPALSQIVFSASSSSSAFGVGTVALCEPSASALTLGLTAAPAQPAGFACLVKRGAASNVTLVPSGTNSSGAARKINNANSKAYAAAGMYWLYFDGENWYG